MELAALVSRGGKNDLVFALCTGACACDALRWDSEYAKKNSKRPGKTNRHGRRAKRPASVFSMFAVAAAPGHSRRGEEKKRRAKRAELERGAKVGWAGDVAVVHWTAPESVVVTAVVELGAMMAHWPGVVVLHESSQPGSLNLLQPWKTREAARPECGKVAGACSLPVCQADCKPHLCPSSMTTCPIRLVAVSSVRRDHFRIARGYPYPGKDKVCIHRGP